MITRPMVEQGVAVVAFNWDSLDASNAKIFREDIQPILVQHRRILLDMESLQFVDSSGLGAIVSCLRAMHEKQGVLALCGMTKPVRTLFELVRMYRIFDIYPTRVEALREMQKDGPMSELGVPHDRPHPSGGNPAPGSGT